MPSCTAVSLRGRVSGWSGHGPRPAVRAPAAAHSLPARSARCRRGWHPRSVGRGWPVSQGPRSPPAAGGQRLQRMAGASEERRTGSRAGRCQRSAWGSAPRRVALVVLQQRVPQVRQRARYHARVIPAARRAAAQHHPPGCRVLRGTAQGVKPVPKKKAPRAHDKREEQQVLRLRQPALALGQRRRPTKLATDWLRCRRLRRRRPAHQGRGPSSTAPLMSGSSPSALPDASMPAASSRDAACVCSWSGISPCRRPMQRPCRYTGRLGITGGSSAGW